ncbi:MAG TPA: MFS transporter [Candidatus Acidoferrum sp.]|nr:MFS transporter [Candidatus Acidoferrum sp.]
MLSSFRYSRFRWLWFSNLAGSAGRWTLVLVLSVQLLQMTHSSFWVGLGLFLTQGPVILLAPISGALADRMDRRTLNVVSCLVSAAVTAVFALLSSAHSDLLAVWMALALIYGLSFVAQMTVRATLTPSLVPSGELLNATSLVQVSLQGAQFAGPLLATPILAAGGPAVAWTFCSLLYVASAALCITIGEVRGGGRREDTGFGLMVAYRYLRSRGAAWVAVWAVALHCMLTMSYLGMLPMFVAVDLHAGTATYGAMLTSIGLGAVIGSLGLAQFAGARYRPALFAYAIVFSGVALSMLGATTSSNYALILGFLVGSSQAMFMSMTLAIIQSSVGDEFRGRATSFYQMITLTPMALFGWGMGGLADVTEPRPLMVVLGIAFIVAMGIYALNSSWLRGLFRPMGWLPVPATAESVV